jgi:hypothetical protein
MTTDEIYFELSNGGDFVRLEPIELIDYKSSLDWDRNWIKTKIVIKGGAFSGQYQADIMTIDFEKFKQELSKLYDNLKGGAIFEDLEHALQLKILGDGNGHFEVKVKANDNPGIERSELSFTLTFDQTQIKDLVNQLDKITKVFPIVGDFKIKNQ